ncbi:hypothetical protein ABBQ38_001745 [Trebouxia sp. C0009 RCD-2024]
MAALTQARDAKGPKAKYLAELHLFYLWFPELCRKCLCPDAAACIQHPSYAELWRRFRDEQAPGQPEYLPKKQIPAALLAWHKWAQHQETLGALDRHQVSLWYGPMRLVRAYDRFVYGSADIVASVQEKSKCARDSVVMLRDNHGKYCAGRVTRFLSHTAPGCQPNPEDDTNIADVLLYAAVPDTHQAAAASSRALGCPIFKRTLIDDPMATCGPS